MLANHDESLYGIKSIVRDLAELAGPLSERQTAEILRRVALHAEELHSLEKFDPVVYKRNSFFKSEHVEMLLLCWRSGQRTPIHDHAGSRCGVYVVRGHATEIAFDRSGVDLLLPSKKLELTRGDITISCDEDVHMVGNFHQSREDLVTLHCYSPPLHEMKVYSQEETFLTNYETIREESKKSGCYRVNL